MSAPRIISTSAKMAPSSSKASTLVPQSNNTPTLTVPASAGRPKTPSRLNNARKTSSSPLLTPKRRAVDKHTQVAAELPALFATHSTTASPPNDGIPVPSSVTDALLELRSWVLERPANMTAIAKNLRAADLLTPINFTSQTQIGLNLAAADVDGHIKRFEREPEVMRAIGACVVEAWAELGHTLVEGEEMCGESVRCCCVQ